MTATDATTRVVSDSGNDIGPGQRLREAREAANLTLAEVASRMRLEPHVLELLEGDHYERLHGATFVRGYLSGYARLLDLPERPILEAYERHGYGPPALVSELGRKPEVHVSDFPVRMVTYVIAGLLVVLVVLWWQSRQPPIGGADVALPGGDAPQSAGQPAGGSETADAEPTDNPQTTTLAATTEESAEADQTTSENSDESPSESASESPSENSDESASESANESANVVEEQPPLPTVANEQTTGTEAAYVEVPPAETQTASQDIVPAPGDESSGESQSPGASQVEALESTGEAEADAATADAETEEQAPLPAPLPGSDRLAIQLARESWVEIYDRGGGRLYYSLVQEGSEVVVQGAGPMRVLLGDVEGAAVAYNGEAFDLSPYQGRSVVRFTIGEPSSTTVPEAPAPAQAQEPLTLESQQSEFGPVVHASPALSPPAAASEPRREESPGAGTVTSETANNPGPPDS